MYQVSDLGAAGNHYSANIGEKVEFRTSLQSYIPLSFHPPPFFFFFFFMSSIPYKKQQLTRHCLGEVIIIIIFQIYNTTTVSCIFS